MTVYPDPKSQARTAAKEVGKINVRNEIQSTYRSHPMPWFGWVFSHLHLPARARVLEIGCGAGGLWQENQDRIPPGWQILLSDLLPGMVEAARERLPQPAAGAGYLSLDSQRLAFPPESFDAVLAVGVLDLVPDLDQALREAWRVLRPSGLLIATAGGQRHLQELRAMLDPYLPGQRAELLGGQQERFGLENGSRRLGAYFDEIARYDYRDTLQFREPQPILDYILSEPGIAGEMRLHHFSMFVQALKRKLTQDGRIAVTVQKGLFAAQKQATRSRG